LKKGFSLPLWVAGASKSAVKSLFGLKFEKNEVIKLPNQNKFIKIEVHSAALINGKSQAIGISFAKSDLDLDITQNMEIWVIASLDKNSTKKINNTNSINIIAGYGVGVIASTSDICISNFAKELLYENLLEFVPEGLRLNIEIIFPNGKFLAERTSNKSFGIVEGLSIIGTSAETHSSASPEQLKIAKNNLQQIIKNDFKGKVVFVIGENGLNLAKSRNLKFPIIKVGNWIGPLLVDAAMNRVKTVIIFGYHGKLIKLAGGIFHTHNHLADGRIEILVYLAVKEQIPSAIIMHLSKSNSIEEALLILEEFSKSKAEKLWNTISKTIEKRSFEYVNRYVKTDMKIAAVIFDRQRLPRWFGDNGQEFISSFQSK
tara:strand:+ start:69 stop:1187 length:1119 start_codon:yes stop_codon:yes gene_type:complete